MAFYKKINFWEEYTPLGSRDAEFLLAANRHQPKRGLLDRGPRKTIPAGLGRSIIETCSLFDYFVDAQTTQINLC